MWRSGLLLTLALALLAGCGETGESQATERAPQTVAADLTGRSFVSTAVAGRRLVPRTEVAIAFEAKRLSASAGCNTLGGGWSVAGGRLRVGDLAQTQIGCDERLMRQDRWLQSFLAAGPRVLLDGVTLRLVRGRSRIVLRDGATAGAPPPIAGTRWRLETIGGRDGTVSSVPAGVRAPTLRIAEDGDVALFAGCNQGGGRAEVRDDGFVVFEPLVLTRMACGRAAMQVEAAVTAILAGSVAAGFDGAGNLSLAKGGRHLVFAPAR